MGHICGCGASAAPETGWNGLDDEVARQIQAAVATYILKS